jgi:hypothetical protein
MQDCNFFIFTISVMVGHVITISYATDCYSSLLNHQCQHEKSQYMQFVHIYTLLSSNTCPPNEKKKSLTSSRA